MLGKVLMLGAVLAVAQDAPAPAAAPRTDPGLSYRREVFQYRRAGRPDPFRSLVNSADLAVRVEDLTLLGVVYHAEPGRSVAVLARRGVDRPIRARVGQRVGGLRIAAIRPRSIDVLIEEFGVARRATIELRTPQRKGGDQ